ncbi:MAG: tetratricopeptide repeat protein [Armatimonadota bacterium]
MQRVVAAFRSADVALRGGNVRKAADLLGDLAKVDANVVVQWTAALAYIQLRDLVTTNQFLSKAQSATHGDPVTMLLKHAVQSLAGTDATANATWLEITRKYGSDTGALELTTPIRKIKDFMDRHASCCFLLLLLADLHQFAGEPQASQEIYKRILKLQPEWPRPHINYGLALLSTGKFEDAIRILERAVALDPNDAKAALLLGDARMKGGAQSDRPDAFGTKASPDLVVTQGIAELKRGNLDRARRDFKSARTLAPLNPAPAIGLADVERIDRNYAKAASHYTDALQLAIRGGYAASEPAIRLSLADVYVTAGRFHEAMDVLDAGLKRFPLLMDKWNSRRADAADGLHNAALAEQVLRSSLETVEASELECVRALQKRGLIEKCMLTYQTELSRKPSGVRKYQIQTAIGHLLTVLGDHSAAYAIRLEVANSRGRGIDWYRVGTSAMAAQKPLESKDAFRRAMSTVNLPADIRKAIAPELSVPK